MTVRADKVFYNSFLILLDMYLKQIFLQTEQEQKEVLQIDYFHDLFHKVFLLHHKDIFNLLIKSKNNREIIVPTYNGQQCNPVLFSKSMKKQIMTIEGDVGAKKILQLNKDKILNIETNDQNVTRDFNTRDNFSS